MSGDLVRFRDGEKNKRRPSEYFEHHFYWTIETDATRNGGIGNGNC